MNAKIQILQEQEKEQITEITVIKACSYINNIALSQKGDFLLFVSALNLCNTYVKQKNSKIGYSFKNDLEYLLCVVVNETTTGVFFDLQQDRGMSLLVVQIDSIQFSFHGIKAGRLRKLLMEKPELCKSLEWDGIRKQQCANTVFELAELSPCQTGLTFRGKSLSERVQRDIQNYNSGKSKCEEIVKFRR